MMHAIVGEPHAARQGSGTTGTYVGRAARSHGRARPALKGLLARASALVVEPRPALDGRAESPPGTGVRALVLGSPPDALPLGGALAGSLRARKRAAAALVCAWAPQDPAVARPIAAWAGGGARRLSERLRARGVAARAAGRLAWLDLPAEATEAASVLARVLGWLDVPVVTVLAGPRTQALIDAADALEIVVAVRPAAAGLSTAGAEAIAALALEDAGAGVACDPLAGALACRRARAGIARLPSGHPVLAPLGAPSGGRTR